METDRNVAEYMQIRNLLSRNVARVLAAQLLLVAVFFCGYLFIQNAAELKISLHNARIIVKSALVILSLLIALCSTLVMNNVRKLYKTIPDEIGIRASQEVINEAFSVAKDALFYNMTLSGVILSAGIFASLALYIALDATEAGVYFSKALFFVTVAICILIFVPSFDRLQVYKLMLLQKHGLNMNRAFIFEGTLAGILMPLSVAIYLFWRYFGNNRTIAWVIFPGALLVYGIILVLTNAEQNCNT